MGDADLDGKCGDNDVTLVGAFYDFGVTTTYDWVNGDFNFDGRVDDSDVTLLGAFYSETQNPLSAQKISTFYGPQFASAFKIGEEMTIPEPTAISFYSLMLAFFQRRL